MSSNPAFILIGMSGALGKEAEKAAEDVGRGFVLVLGIAAVVALLYFALKFFARLIA